jgi:dTDP-4-dehydrorhamnose 3,5-epimerase
MRVEATPLPGVLLIETRRFRDPRGYFQEMWNQQRYREAGVPGEFVQDNLSMSRKGVLRGLHYQLPHAQAKLVSVMEGEIWDVAVDLRLGSETFGRWHAETLSAENARQLYIPGGFAHGFVVLSETALVSYKCTDHYHPEAEHTLLWDDPELGIDWPVADPVLSEKDGAGRLLRDIPRDGLPRLERLA